jgi:acyl dehydratase
MALDPEFVEDCCYLPGGLLIDEVLEVDREASLVRVRMPTHSDLPITREQRAHPVRHPRHVSGGLMVHMTGVAGLVHAYYVLGLRHRDGWVGYGGAIHRARFKHLAPPGDPIEIVCKAKHVRPRERNVVARYDLRFFQRGKEVYEGDQTAMWLKVEDADAGPS